MRVLVTGSRGVIGRRLVETLEERNEVWCTDRIRMKAPNYIPADITRYETLEPAFDMARPDIVYHLAGEVSREICDHWPTVAAEANILGTMNVALLCLKHSARIVYAGSSEEYGDAFGQVPVTEHTPLGRPRGIYALTKRMAEDVIEHWHRMRELDAILLRIFMCYGREEPTAYRSAIARFIYRARSGLDLIVHRGTERSWCYIDDIVDGMIRAGEFMWSEGRSQCEIFLLGRDEPISTEELARRIIELSNSKSSIRLIDPPIDVTPIKRASFDKAARLLGWTARTPIEIGLRKEIEWQKEKIPINDEIG